MHFRCLIHIDFMHCYDVFLFQKLDGNYCFPFTFLTCQNILGSSLLGNYRCSETFLNMTWHCAVQVRASRLILLTFLVPAQVTKHICLRMYIVYTNMKDLLPFSHFFKYVNSILRCQFKCYYKCWEIRLFDKVLFLKTRK